MGTTSVAGVLADLHLLTVIAQTRSLTQAARRLAISKASVSARLQHLETVIGMSLARRTTRSVTLTAAATQLVQDIQGSFARIEQSLIQARDVAGAPRGLVRMSVPVALGRQKIAPAVPAFLQSFPDIRLEVDLNDRFINLAQEGFDLAIRHARSIPDSYVARVLCESRSVLLASRAYLDRRGVPEHPHDLARHDCLLYLRDAGAQSWSFERVGSRRRGRQVSVPVGGPFKANNSEVLRAALMGGAGIGLLPDFSIDNELASGALVALLSEWRPVGFFGDRIYAVRPGGVRASRAVECALDYFAKTLAAARNS